MKTKCKNCALICAKRKKEIQKNKRKMIIGHIILFVTVETLLLQGIFGEWPSIELMSLTGVGHIVYYLSIPLALVMATRHHRIRHLWYVVPVAIHLLVHLAPVWLYADKQPKVRAFGMHHVQAHKHTDVLQINSYELLILAIVTLVLGEYLLHRKRSALGVGLFSFDETNLLQCIPPRNRHRVYFTHDDYSMKFTSLLPLAVATLALTACGTQSTPVADTPTQPTTEFTNQALKIVTTFPSLYAHALNIADENDTVTNLIPADTSVHTRQPTPQDVATLENADIIVTNGLDLEEFLEEYLDDLEERGVTIVDTSAGIDTIEFGDSHDDDHHDEDDDHDDHGHHHHHDGTDPHIWLSIPNAKQQAKTITQALITADDSAAQTYTQNNTIYQQKLTDLDQHIRSSIASGSVSPFVVFHDAYGYYLREYGIHDKQVGMIQSDHNDSPSQADIAALMQQIRDAGVTKLFVEPQFNPSVVQALQEEVEVTVLEIDPIGSQMDADGYIANMKAMTEAFTK